MSQTAGNDNAGARSPLAAVATAAVVVITLLFVAPVFSYLPQAALGALAFVAAIGLVDVVTVRATHLRRQSPRSGPVPQPRIFGPLPGTLFTGMAEAVAAFRIRAS